MRRGGPWSFADQIVFVQSAAIKDIFQEFDVSGDRQLDYQEFCMFTMACVERQKKMVVDEETKSKRCLIFWVNWIPCFKKGSTLYRLDGTNMY